MAGPRRPRARGGICLAQEEAGAERVVGVELELGGPRAEGRALDLRDDGAVDAVDDSPAELGADDRAVAELLPDREVEQREPRRRARAARRAIDLAVGEHRDVALREDFPVLRLPEDHAVDVAQLGLVRVDDLVRSLEVALDRAAELDQPWELAGLDALGTRRVERAAERDVDLVP